MIVAFDQSPHRKIPDQGLYQIGEPQARSWMVAGTSFSNSKLLRTAS